MFLWWSIYTSRKVTSKEPQTPRESCLLSPLHFPIRLPWTSRLLRLWALRWRSVMQCFSELLMCFWRKNPLIQILAFSEIFGLWRILRDLGKISLPWYSQEDHSFQCTFLVTPSHGEETMMIFPVYMLGHVGCHVPRSKRWFSTRLTLDAWGRVSCASVDGMARVAWMVEVAEFGMERSDIKPPHAIRCWVSKGLQFVITPGSCDVNVSGHLNIIEYHCKKVNIQMYASIFWCFFLQAWQTWYIPT